MASTQIARARSVEGRLGTRREGIGPRPVTRHRAAARRTALRQWLFPLAVSVLLALLVEGTYVLSERNATGQAIFAGQSWAPHDVAQYLAAVEDGRAGAIL